MAKWLWTTVLLMPYTRNVLRWEESALQSKTGCCLWSIWFVGTTCWPGLALSTGWSGPLSWRISSNSWWWRTRKSGKWSELFAERNNIRSLEKPRGLKRLVLPYQTPKKRQPPVSHWQWVYLTRDSTVYTTAVGTTKESKKLALVTGEALFVSPEGEVTLGWACSLAFWDGLGFDDTLWAGEGFDDFFDFKYFAAEAGRRVALITMAPSNRGTISSSSVTSNQTTCNP